MVKSSDLWWGHAGHPVLGEKLTDVSYQDSGIIRHNFPTCKFCLSTHLTFKSSSSFTLAAWGRFEVSIYPQRQVYKLNAFLESTIGTDHLTRIRLGWPGDQCQSSFPFGDNTFSGPIHLMYGNLDSFSSETLVAMPYIHDLAAGRRHSGLQWDCVCPCVAEKSSCCIVAGYATYEFLIWIWNYE